MTTRLEVESVIKQLPESEVRDLAKWLQEYLDEIVIANIGLMRSLNVHCLVIL